MKKPKKRDKARAAPQTRAPAAPDLQAEAPAHLAAGRYREAIAGFKEMLKGQDQPQWRQGLGDSYAGRARELAAKGMPKEALAMWENRARIVPDAPLEPDHAALLLRLGRIATVAGLLRGGTGLPDAVASLLRSHLAAHHLAGETQIAAALPADDPILVQGPAASAALDAWCNGDDAALRAALMAIPFRSPYRDLAQILKALSQIPEHPAEAAALLAKVADDSGFAPLRWACELALTPPQALLERLPGTGAAARRFALTLAGWSAERQAIWEDVHKLGDPGPQVLLRLMHRRRAELGEDWVRAQALRLLLPGFPGSAGWLAQAGGRRLSEAERLLLSAWKAEQRGDPWDAFSAWSEYLLGTRQAEPLAPDSDQALRIALVQRRVDRRYNILSDAQADTDADDLDHHISLAVQASLSMDPEHRESYERLVRYHLRGKRMKQAREVLALGLGRFPRDVGLLTVALELALATGSFKKATRHAREILEIDPINTGARERLVNAHLAHARKQIAATRPDLARRELEQAGEWDRGNRRRDRRSLIEALITLAEDRPRGEALLAEQYRTLGSGLAAAFALAREGAATRQGAALILKAAGLSKPPVPKDAEDVTGFLSRLRASLDAGEQITAELSRLFEPPLAKAAHLTLPRPELERACETLSEAELNAARLAFAKAALKRWPEEPVFVLHHYEAKGARTWSKTSELDRLAEASLRARQTGDLRTAHRIQAILDDFHPFGRGFVDDSFDPFDRLPDPPAIDPQAIIADLLENFDLDRLLDMIGPSPRERRRYKELEREFGRRALKEILLTELSKEMSDFGAEPPFPPFPSPRPPRGSKSIPKPATGRGARAPQDDNGPDDEPDDDQLELF